MIHDTLPVLMKENRSRMRGVWGMALLFGTTLLAILIGVLAVLPRWHRLTYDPTSLHSTTGAGATGQLLLAAVLVLEGVLCALIVPGLTAGAIVVERAQGSFQLLLLTHLSSRNIVIGKYLASLGFAALLVLCTLPVAAVVFTLGGMSPGQVLWTVGLILAMAACLGAMGLYCSARFANTVTAAAVAYALVFVWVFLMPLVVGLHDIWFQFSDMTPAYLLAIAAVPSPFFAWLVGKLIAAPLAVIRVKQASREFSIILFTILTVFFLALIYYPLKYLSLPLGSWAMDFPEYLLIGNPLAGIVHQMSAWELIWPDWQYLPWTLRFYTPIAVAVQIIGAGVFLRLTIKRVERMRRVE